MLTKGASTAFLCFLCLVKSAHSQQNQLVQFSREAQPYMDQVVAKNTLTYGQSCDIATEKTRTQLAKSVLDELGSINVQNFNFETYKARILGILRSMAEVTGPMCNTFASLQCNSDKVCDCASADESFGFKTVFTREGDVCVLSGGSLCAPQDALDETRRNNPIMGNVPKQEMACSARTHCVVKSDGRTCNSENMKEEIKRMIEKQGHIANPVQFILQKTKEGICVCKGSLSVAASYLLIAASSILCLSRFLQKAV